MLKNCSSGRSEVKMIIFNEQQYADELIRHGFPTMRISKRDLIILAKKYRSDGLSGDENYEKIVAFCEKWCKKFVEAKYQTAILDAIYTSALPSAAKIRKDAISFSLSELDTLAQADSLGGEGRALLFAIMCVCKMYDRDNLWVNSKSKIQLKDLAILAGVRGTNLSHERLLHKMIIHDYIAQDYPNLLRLKISCLDYEEPELEFKPTESMVEWWRMWYRKNYTECEVCGKAVRRANNKTKYCPDCARETAARQRREYNAKHR